MGNLYITTLLMTMAIVITPVFMFTKTAEHTSGCGGPGPLFKEKKNKSLLLLRDFFSPFLYKA